MNHLKLLAVPTLVLFSQTNSKVVLAAEPDFEHEFSILADLSKAGGYTGEETSAQRALVTWDAQYQLSPRWTVAGNLKAFRGDNGEALTDNIQGISNIDAERFSKIYELFMEYQWNEQTRLKCGQVDANIEFAVVPAAGAFISPPLGITPTAIALPTYYDPALSCSAFYEPERGFQAMAGVFAGRDHLDFADQFMVIEGRYVQEHGQLVVGHWQHNGEWPLNETVDFVAISGWYANYQHQINDDLTVFIGLSALLDEVDAIEEHRLIGIVYQLPWQEQQLGLMASQVTVPTANDELQLEAYWQLPITENLVLQPVVQYIDQVAGTDRNAWVGTLRVAITY